MNTQVDLLLKPLAGKAYIESVDVRIAVNGRRFSAGETMFSINSLTVGIPFTPLSEEIAVYDETGTVSLAFHTEDMVQILKKNYICQRDTAGTVHIVYRVLLGPVKGNPPFDLGYEDGGMCGSGMTFLPLFTGERCQFHVHWDLSALSAQSRGICSMGEGDVTFERTPDALQLMFYYAGMIKSAKKDNFAYYWFRDDPFQPDEIAEWTAGVFSKLAEFFGDHLEPYSILTRKSATVNKSGGTALTRSYTHVYPGENPPKLESLKFLFPHEMVHNWLIMDDQPFGTCTILVEGSAEFYSAVLPWRFGLIDRKELLEMLNKRAEDYYCNPKQEYPALKCGELLFKDEEATKVPYGRGFFYLLEMDDRIRRETGGKASLDDVILPLVERARQGEQPGIDDWLEEINKHIVYSKAEIQAVLDGKVVQPVVASFVNAKLEIVKLESFTRKENQPCVLYQFK